MTSLFLLVVLTGAIRAIRHPERYGPRRLVQRGEGGEAEYVGYQSRAGGLTRAILDTIPIVKFGARPAAAPSPRRSTLEHRESTYKLDDVELSGGVKELHYAGQPDDTLPQLSMRGRPRSMASTSALATDSAAEEGEVGVDPALVDDSQQCPICVEDFADGDDIRVLPCDERHRFVRHVSAVRPLICSTPLASIRGCSRSRRCARSAAATCAIASDPPRCRPPRRPRRSVARASPATSLRSARPGGDPQSPRATRRGRTTTRL